MYVAMTRARQRLHISLAQTRMLHGQTRYNMRSRFLDELPPDHVRWLTPRVATGMGTEFGSGRARGFSPTPAISGAGGSGRAIQLGVHDSGFRVGQTVNHARFGPGVIVGLEGSGQDARAQIQFKRDGLKWLALSVAKLEAA
jgi:DNA helicase-2/ATP-dependent DNA helicase PcrA